MFPAVIGDGEITSELSKTSMQVSESMDQELEFLWMVCSLQDGHLCNCAARLLPKLEEGGHFQSLSGLPYPERDISSILSSFN